MMTTFLPRCLLLLGFLLNTVFPGPIATAAGANPRPNVIVFLADDAGWGDYGVTGNTRVRTPHIDSLARDGVTLDRFFVQPVCSPTRAEFLTGRYHPRTGVRGVSTGHERLNLDERTIAEAFRAAGYATGAFGKWHNGSQWPYHPRARGFDEYYGHTAGHWGEYFDPPLERDGRMERARGYIVDVCTDEALGFIERHRARPFFCFVPFTTPHSPWAVPEEDWRRHRDAPLTQTATQPGQENPDHTRCALAMMENQDRNVGLVLRKLEELGLAENTIVLYFSDNGPNSARWNGGMKGRKGGVDEGSVRSVCFLRWPARLPNGRVVLDIAGAIDLLPTLIALAGIPRVGDAPLDGHDLTPWLLGRPVEAPDRRLFASWGGRVSVRTARHRLDDAGRLFDPVADPGQARDLSSDHPEVAARLRQAVADWRQEMFGAAPGPRAEQGVDPRPIPVGFPEFPITLLPARDGEPRGGVRRSSSAPNCSYFVDWTNTTGHLVWNVEVRTAGTYDVAIDYTCPEVDAGSVIELEFQGRRLQGRVTPGWNPPLDPNQDTLPRPPAESPMKPFRALHLGTMALEPGRGPLTLRALEIPGRSVMDVRRVALTLLAPPPPARPRAGQNRPVIPEVARPEVIGFAYYTVNRGVLKLTAQLYPLRDGESRETRLEVQRHGAWETLARARVTEDPYNNARRDRTWTAHFRVENWDEARTVPYRVVALDGIATYEGTIRANPTGKRELVVAAFTGNSNQDRRLKPELIANLKAQDPDLLFFSGDQVYDHTEHLGAWLLFGRQFGEIVRDRPMISLPDDHDVGQANLWGASGKVATTAAGDDGGYFMPVEYVRAVERAQTWHLPDPVDPAPIERGLGVYFTTLHWGDVSFAILEDRKFKTGPNGPLQLKPRFAPRPDWVTNAAYDPKALDLPGLELLGPRQEKFLEAWAADWTGAEFKVALSQTLFSYATHLSHGNRLLADLDSNGWPQSGRRRALERLRRCFAVHLCGDQHLGCVVQYGLEDWRDASLAFCVPSIVNYYPRQWLPLEPPVRRLEGPLPHLGDFTEGFGNRLTVFAYANPEVFPAPRTNLAASASGHGLVRFDKAARRVTFECWPRGVDVTRPDARQYAGWPITVDPFALPGHRPVAFLPEVEAPAGIARPVVQVFHEPTGELAYALRVTTPRFQPSVDAEGTYTVRIGEPPDRMVSHTGLRARRP